MYKRQIDDSIVIGQPWRGDIRVVLYVKLQDECELTAALELKIRTALKTQASARHVPGLITKVNQIPYTRSGKKVELAVRDIAMGREPANRETLQDPTAFDCYYEL